MDETSEYSKRQVSRAGRQLAARLEQVRRAERNALVDPSDPSDQRAQDIVEWWQAEHVAPMLAVYDMVANLASQLEVHHPQVVRAVSFRPKRFQTTIEKLTREPGKLSDMADIGGVRAVVNAQEEVDELGRLLRDTLDVRRTRDWARTPRSSGYRAVHLHVRQDGRMVEVQLRTFGQDAWANIVEEESLLSGINYKAGQGEPAVLEFFRVVADLFGTLELGEIHPGLPERLQETLRRAKPLFCSPTLRDLAL